MKSINLRVILIILSITLLSYLISVVYAQELPNGIKLMVEYATQQAQKLTFLTAYFGGILTFLSPCILPLFLIFLTISFQEQRNLVKTTLIFSSGLTTVYAFLGIGAFYLSNTLGELRGVTITLAGVILIIMGISIVSGRGFALIKPPSNMKFNALGVYFLGVFFAIGFTPCIGPIYASILFISSFLQRPFYSAALMVSYAMGIATPLLVMAILWNRVDFTRFKISEIEFNLPVVGRRCRFHPVGLVASIILISIGIVFLLYGGTYIFNFMDPFRTKQYFYITQSYLLNNPVNKIVNNIFAIVSIAIVIYIGKKYFFREKVNL